MLIGLTRWFQHFSVNFGHQCDVEGTDLMWYLHDSSPLCSGWPLWEGVLGPVPAAASTRGKGDEKPLICVWPVPTQEATGTL